MKQPRRGISFGTILMTVMTVAVLGLSAAIMPRLLGTADFDMDVGGVIAALSLNDTVPVLTLSEIPITDATEVPAATAVPVGTPAPAATPTPVPTATPFPGGTVTLTLGGSINIEEKVRQSAYYKDSKKYDFTEIMALLRDEMKADLTLVTLENITCDAEKVSNVNAPSAVMDMLADAGVDIVALGYPKAYDKGIAGLRATVEAARERDMTTLGAYDLETDANTLRMFTIDHVNVAFLHYTESISDTGRKAIRNDGTSYALPTTMINGTPDAMLADIKNAREAGADIVIVSLNWGKQSTKKPTEAQRTLAQQIAEAGADVIVGAGSRVVQPVTWLTSRDENGSIRQTLCAWSLGSLISDSRKDGNVAGMLLQLELFYDGSIISFNKVAYTPTYVWKFSQDGGDQYRIAVSDQPAPDGMDKAQIGYMEKAYKNVQSYLDDSPVTLRVK